jgi:hypothetical protein
MEAGMEEARPAPVLAAVEGEVVPGHRVASGACNDARFPQGTLRPQLPFFRSAIGGFDDYLGGEAYPGTINVRLPGRVVEPGTAEHRLPNIAWTTAFGPETFLISRAALQLHGRMTPAYLYIPDPATKPDHHQARDVVELIAGHIPDLRYGASVTLLFEPVRLRIR